jgi:hypothetical protein
MPAGNYDLAALGYGEREYLIEGVATSFELTSDRTSDGRWTVRADEDAPFVSRFVVRRPLDLARFSGTVAVEWHNVSGGLDAGPDWSLLHRELVAQGHAWVGVSAQRAGIEGGGLVEGMHLKLVAPERYAPLVHPGDKWSYDIFTQVGQVLRSSADESVLDGRLPERLIAVGESQSAAFLVTYINAVDHDAEAFDGFFVHGRGAGGAGLDGFRVSSSASLGDRTQSTMSGSAERIRDDARVPVLVLQSETDVVLLGGGLPVQPDGEHLRLWEIAGSAHADTYLLVASAYDDGKLAPARLAELLRPTTELVIGNTDTPINSGPQQHYVGQAAFSHLAQWVAGGPPPPMAPRLEVTSDNELVLDQFGNATGGIRTPWVDVPTATLSGLGQSGETFAILFGRTEPFDPPTLASLYPGGRSEYLERFEDSLGEAITAGFILSDNHDEIASLAEASYPVPSG